MKKIFLLFLILFLLANAFPVFALGTHGDYSKRYHSIQSIRDIEANGFNIFNNQIFNADFENFGKVSFIPAFDNTDKKMAVFLANNDGKIIYKTDNIESIGKVEAETQNTHYGVSAVAFRDINADGLKDIILIYRSMNKNGVYTGNSHKTGDVLFQRKDGFYRDSRISEFINRFSMNQNVETIVDFVKGKRSREFLYTAKTLSELTAKDFRIIEDYSFQAEIEAFGHVRIVPGTYAMGGLRSLMLYIVDLSGNICARIDVMKDYDHCSGLKDITLLDVNGDGLKDIIILAEYKNSAEIDFSNAVVETGLYVGFQKYYWFERNFAFDSDFSMENLNDLHEITEEIKNYFSK